MSDFKRSGIFTVVNDRDVGWAIISRIAVSVACGITFVGANSGDCEGARLDRQQAVAINAKNIQLARRPLIKSRPPRRAFTKIDRFDR